MGLSYKEIALQLKSAPGTVDTHLKHVRRKLGVTTTKAAGDLHFGPRRLPNNSGAELFGTDDVRPSPPSEVDEALPSPSVAVADPVTADGGPRELTAWEKTGRILLIAVGSALAAGATLPGTLLLLHALQSLHGAH